MTGKTTYATGPGDRVVLIDVASSPPQAPTNANISAPPKLGQGRDEYKVPTGGSGGGGLSGALETGKMPGNTGGNMSQTLLPPLPIKGSGGELYNVLNTTLPDILNPLLKDGDLIKSGINKVVNGIANSVSSNELYKALGSGLKQVTVKVDSVAQHIKNFKVADIEEVQKLSKALGILTGNREKVTITDLTGVSGIVKGILDLTESLDLPPVFGDLISELSESDQKVVTLLVASGLSQVKDRKIIDDMLKIISPDELRYANPEIVKIVVGDFNPGKEFITPSNDAADSLLATITSIHDNWNKEYVGDGEWSDSLEVYRYFSPFARDCFLAAGYDRERLAVAPAYTPREFGSLVKEFFPHTPI